MKKPIPRGSRPITLASDNALWQGKRTADAFTWGHQADLPPSPSPQEAILRLFADAGLTPKQQQRLETALERLPARQAEKLLLQLEMLSPAQHRKALGL